ncbi:helix-turn-helix domain-containing protein [Nocardiopsis sp. CNT-189]|uniref:helix-turn-helix domain-containing protein n=1 Tax=Nocardiopsis oceanisediminis TaxID=2816862 RepID=UPI003B314CF0
MADRGPKKRPLVVGDDDRRALEQIARRRTSAQFMAQRARIVLRCAEGGSDGQVARELGIWPQTVHKWRNRYIEPFSSCFSELKDQNSAGDLPGPLRAAA